MTTILQNQVHAFHATAMLVAAGNHVNTGGADVAVAQNIGQFHNVFFNTVKGACKQVAQIVRK